MKAIIRCTIGLGLWILSILPVAAEDYPNQVIKLVVPFAAGGGVDVAARILAPKLAETLGGNVIVEDRGGAGGMLGASYVAQATPDGYTLLVGTGSTHGTNSSVYTKLTYDPERDFTPVILMSQSPLLLVVRPSLPAKTVSEFIALAHSKPGKLSYGSYGVGSINHLGAELFNAMAHTETNHVPYHGSAPALTDLVGGHIDYTFDGVSTSVGYVRAGTLRLLGVASSTRTPVLPDAPTIAEAALPGFDSSVWFGLFAPANTPKPIVDILNAKMNSVLRSPEVKESFAKLGFEALGGTPDVLAQREDAEIKKWADLVREKNIHVEP